jgi:MFS family permease
VSARTLVARPPLWPAYLGGYGTALSAGLGGGPIIAGAVADAGGFGWAFAVIGSIGVVVAVVAATILVRARRRPEIVVFD